jgi:hypothetical protein
VKKSAFASKPRHAVDKDARGGARGRRLSRMREASDHAAGLTVALTDKRARAQFEFLRFSISHVLKSETELFPMSKIIQILHNDSLKHK